MECQIGSKSRQAPTLKTLYLYLQMLIRTVSRMLYEDRKVWKVLLVRDSPDLKDPEVMV